MSIETRFQAPMMQQSLTYQPTMQSQFYPTQQQSNIDQTFHDDVNVQIQKLEEKLAQEKEILEQRVKNIEKNRSQMSKMFQKFPG